MHLSNETPDLTPEVKLLSVLLSFTFFLFSNLTAEAFREWTFWILSISLLMMNITVIFPKFIKQIKDIFKK